MACNDDPRRDGSNCGTTLFFTIRTGNDEVSRATQIDQPEQWRSRIRGRELSATRLSGGTQLSARESVSLLHADSSSVETQGVGTMTDFVLRLAGPVLLAFIVLALRARTKR